MRVYTDGACRKGVGGWAWWNADTDESRSGVETRTTNQRMELKAALEAVSEFLDDKELTIVSDSAYVVNCFGQRWWIKWLANGWVGSKGKELANRDLWEPLLGLVRWHGNIQFEWVKGHSGDPGNDKVDTLAVEEVLRHGRAAQFTEKEAERKKQAAERDRVHHSNRTASGVSADAVADSDHADDSTEEPGGRRDRLPDDQETDVDPLMLSRETYKSYKENK